MNADHPLHGRSPRAELAQAVERHALLQSHPAAADYPDLVQAIADTQDQINILAAELRASDELPASLSPSRP